MVTSKQNANTHAPYNYTDVCDISLSAGDIVVNYANSKYCPLEIGVVKSARKHPVKHQLTLCRFAPGYPDGQDYNIYSDTSKFMEVKIISPNSIGINAETLNGATKLMGVPFILPAKEIPQHTFNDFQARWNRAFNKSLNKLSKNIVQHCIDIPARSIYISQYVGDKWSTSWSADKFSTTLRVDFQHNQPAIKYITFTIHKNRGYTPVYSVIIKKDMGAFVREVGTRYNSATNSNVPYTGEIDGNYLITESILKDLEALFNV